MKTIITFFKTQACCIVAKTFFITQECCIVIKTISVDIFHCLNMTGFDNHSEYIVQCKYHTV